MTPLHGLQTASTGLEKREPSREPGDPARALDLYAAWKAIFESARPSAVEPPRSSAAQPPGEQQNSGEPVRSLALLDSRSAGAGALDSRAARERTWIRPQRAVMEATVSDAASKPRTDPLARPSVVGERLPLARKTASAARLEAADVGVRIHYLDPGPAHSPGGPQSEMVSIILEGAQVSIIVRNGDLSEAEALRTAFDTARELTGRSSALQQLTLNGRVLYEQAIRADVAPGGILFA